MDNFLSNGAILPHGLLGESDTAMMAGFNKSYRNFPLRVGVVVDAFSIDDDRNRHGLTTEYDVIVFEQQEDRGATTVRYRNCMSSEGLGSIADFFERTLRVKTTQTNKGSLNLNSQDGSIVLLLCLDGMSDKGIIIGQLTHPDRGTTLTDEGPNLEGEFNGVNIKVKPDGSAYFTWNGPTDNQGKQTDTSLTPTEVRVEADGTFQVMHDKVTVRLDKQGMINITATADVNVNCQNASVTAKETATVEGKTVKLGAGAAEAVVKGDTFKKLFDQHQHPTAMGPSGPPSKPLDPSALSKKAKTE